MLKKYKQERIFSIMGLLLVIIGFVLCLSFEGQHELWIGSILISILGWFIFSHYHTKIAIAQLKQITKDYIDSVKK